MEKIKTAKYLWITGIAFRLLLILQFLGLRFYGYFRRIHGNGMPGFVGFILNLTYILLAFFALLLIANAKNDKMLLRYSVLFLALEIFNFVYEYAFFGKLSRALLTFHWKNVPKRIILPSVLNWTLILIIAILFLLILFRLSNIFGVKLFELAGLLYFVSVLSVMSYDVLVFTNYVFKFNLRFLMYNRGLFWNSVLVGGGFLLKAVALLILLLAVLKINSAEDEQAVRDDILEIK